MTRQLSTELEEGAIPDAARGRAELQRALDRWHDRAKIDLALFDDLGYLSAHRVRAKGGESLAGQFNIEIRPGKKENDRRNNQNDLPFKLFHIIPCVIIGRFPDAVADSMMKIALSAHFFHGRDQ